MNHSASWISEIISNKLKIKIHRTRRFYLYCSLITFVIIWALIWHFSRFGVVPVPGWEGKSRNLSKYINYDLEPLILPKNFCKKYKLLTVIVSSRPEGSNYRKVIRETWGRLNPHITFAYLLGETDDLNLQKQIQMESQKYNDIIQERFFDSYNNLTLKSFFMIKSFLRYCRHTHKLLMKIDDDIYLNIPNILSMLMELDVDSNVFLGRRRVNLVPYRNPFSKWYISYDFYPNDTFPTFLCGPGYVMSISVAEKLVRCSYLVPLVNLEDVYVTGICATVMNISTIGSTDFQCDMSDKNICLNQDKYYVHYFEPYDIRQAHNVMQEDLCSKTIYYKSFNAIGVLRFKIAGLKK